MQDKKMQDKKMLDVLFVTDFVCPYCLVAKEALNQALKEGGIKAKIRICPLELTEEPKERIDTYHDQSRKERYQVLKKPAEELGLAMKFPPAVVPRPYTRLAFEGWYFAEEKGLGDAYGDQVYKAYFIDEKDIGDMEVLADLAERVGLNRQEYRDALLTGKYTGKEKEALRYAKDELKVKQVPTIYFNGREVSLETYTKEEMAGLLAKVYPGP